MAEEIYRKLTREETEDIKVGVFTADCVVQHITALQWQCNSGVVADFAEPCVNCPHIHKCHCDWTGNLEPLFRRSSIAFKPVNRIEFKDNREDKKSYKEITENHTKVQS